MEFSPFDAREDYLRYVDGKPRYDGVQSFLESRGIALPRGKPEDAAEMETVCGLGNRKNALFLAELKEHGVEPYETTICLSANRARGFKTIISQARIARLCSGRRRDGAFQCAGGWRRVGAHRHRGEAGA